MAVISTFNVLTVIVILQRITGVKLLHTIFDYYPDKLAFAILILLLNTVVFIGGGRYRKIISQFSEQSPKQAKKRVLYSRLYIFLTILLCVISLIRF